MSEEAERGVLGSILLRGDTGTAGNVLDLCIDKAVKAADFYAPAHMMVFEAMMELHSKSIPVDVLTVHEALQRAGKIEMIGGATVLAKFIDATPTPAHADYYISIIKSKALLRSVINCAREIEQGAFELEDGDTAEGLRAQAEFMFSMLAERGGRDLMTTKQAVDTIISMIEQAQRTQCAGIPTGYAIIDKFLGGLMAGATIWLSGQPGAGKTTLARNICENLAMRPAPIPSIYFSIEQTCPLVWGSMVARRARQSYYLMLTGSHKINWPRILQAAADVQKYPIIVDDRPQTLSSLRSRIIQYRKKLSQHTGKEVPFVAVVDYLQRMKAGSGKDFKSREAEVSYISSGITDIAKELNLPIIGISSLNREDKLRDSGQLDYDAWGHIRLTLDGEVDDNGDQRVMLNLDKQRFGPHFKPEPMLLIGSEGCFEETREDNTRRLEQAEATQTGMFDEGSGPGDN